MKLKKSSIQKICVFSAITLSLHSITLKNAYANEGPENDVEAPQVPPESSSGQVQGQTSGERVGSAPAEWVIHMHGVLGSAQSSSVDSFKSDRLGAAVYAGTILSNNDLPLFLADAKDFSLGLSYQTFTGVSVNQDRDVALQALGAQARFVVDPSFLNGADLSIHGGVALQRLVSESQKDGLEKVQLGGALTAGAYVRWLVLGPVAVLAGADLVAGSASWGGLSAGVEASF